MAGEIVKQIRITAVKFFVFAVASVMAFMLIYNTMQDAVDGKQVDYHAIFSDVSGLRVGDNVRVAGVQVGKVESIEVKGRQAEIGFTLRETQPLLDTTELVIRYQNLLGQRYISLIQGPKRGTKVPPGATVPINRTSRASTSPACSTGSGRCSTCSSPRTSTSSPRPSCRCSRARAAPSSSCSQRRPS